MAVSFAAAAAKLQAERQPLQRVQLEGQVVLKVAQHCRTAEASVTEAAVTGQVGRPQEGLDPAQGPPRRAGYH